MCGICGYFDKDRITEEQLSKMNDAMRHRGPNDSGIWQCQEMDGFIGFAQRRLSILDLSELGHQPMLSEDNNHVIVFNGEIYNFKELKQELLELGHRFRSACDTEVILAAYRQWGEQVVYHIDGMFAFAVLDRKNGMILCARDRIGKKPFYYYWDGQTFIFASELKAIIRHPKFSKKLNRVIIEKYMCYQYINEPDTIYERTYKLPAGHYMVLTRDDLRIEKYWDIYKQYQNGKKNAFSNYEECKEALKECICRAVKRRLVADVPVGTFLSGGIDSTLITAVANEAVDGGIETFTIGFEDKERNEATFALETAKYIGTRHRELYVKEEDMVAMIKDLCQYFDEPFADPSEIPMMLVSKLAKEKVAVALTGDGGDEFFCGYSMYDFVHAAQRLDGLARCGNALLSNRLGGVIRRKLPAELVALLENRDNDYKVQLFADLPQKFVSKMMMQKNGDVKYDLEGIICTDNWQEKRMILDMYTYLPEDVLMKADRASMKYSLELRCPLLDREVMECSFQIPHEFKYKHGEKKYILKDVLYDYVPKEMMNRPKNGFGVPLGRWLRTYLKDEIAGVSKRNFIEEQGIFRYEVIWELIEKVNKSDKKPYPKILWAYYVFQLWYKMYIM